MFKDLFVIKETEITEINELFSGWEVANKIHQQIVDAVDDMFNIDSIKVGRFSGGKGVAVKIDGIMSQSEVEYFENQFEDFVFSFNRRKNVLYAIEA